MGEAGVSDPGELQRWRGVASVSWLALLLLWETAAPFFAQFRSWRDRGRHALRNVFLAALNALLVSLVFVTLWKGVADWAEARPFGVLNWLPLPGWAHALGAVLLLDCWTYWWHRFGHLLPMLWRFHRMHHSDPQMDVTTANRFHLVEIGLSSGLRLAVIPLAGAHFWEVVLYETLLQAVVQFQHANIGLPGWLERALRLLIVTPGMHKVHHSRWRPETDSNFASLLSVWDRVFGSFRMRARLEEIRFGLDGYDAPEKQSVKGLLKTPWEEGRW